MKLPSTIISLVLYLYCGAQTDKVTRYLDPDNVEISSAEIKKYERLGALIVKNDSLNIVKAIPRVNRSESGMITNYKELSENIEAASKSVIDPLKPIIIIYHPGPDPCNSSGSVSSADRKKWFDELEKTTLKIAGVKPLYFYKVKEGTERKVGFLKWRKDPQGIIEKTFFDFHYPCSSFVIFNSNGKYISHFGEFSKEAVWQHLREIIKTN